MSAAGDYRASISSELTPQQQAAVKGAKHWVNQLARTIKTCRLYDTLAGPVVERSRHELAVELQRLLVDHETLSLRFTSDDILTEGVSLYPARSREDNLALPFHRDGIRAITFYHGVEPDELSHVIDAILSVTGAKQGEDDLVTLLWQAQLDHVEIEYVPADAEVGAGDDLGSGGGSGRGSRGGLGSGLGPGGGDPSLRGGGFGASAGDAGGGTSAGGDGGAVARGPGVIDAGRNVYAPESQGMPWPDVSIPFELPDVQAAPDSGATVTDPGPGRSDDWQVDADTVEAESTFAELELAAAPELASFRARLEAERSVTTVAAAVELSRAYLAASDTDEDRIELAQFLSTVIRHAAIEADWSHAAKALTLLEECANPTWSIEPLAEELCHPRCLAATVSAFSTYEAAQVEELVAFAQRLGDWAIDLLGPILAEIEGSRHQARLIEAIADECRECPERLAPWLADPRWTVVRGTVRILGAIGGDGIAGLLHAVARHERAEVREAVLAALETVSVSRAKPMLMTFLDDVDTRAFCSIVHRLGRSRDAQVTELMLGYLTHPEFEKQPMEERRAIYAAVVTAGGDDALPGLEAELHNQDWFDRNQDAHRQAVANCILQIGTPQAKRVLERGAKSHRAALRKTCEEMLARFGKP